MNFSTDTDYISFAKKKKGNAVPAKTFPGCLDKKGELWYTIHCSEGYRSVHNG